MNNLYGKAEYTRLVDDLKKRLEELQIQYKDSTALTLNRSIGQK